MTKYSVEDIRNVVLVGHAGAGKTTLGEAILHKSGITNRLGSVDDKTSILDTDDEERAGGHSIDSAIMHVNHKNKELNLIDTPGYPDFIGAALSALPAAETAVVVISASAGIQMNTIKMFNQAKARGMACVILINKIDSDPGNLTDLLASIKETFGSECCCANVASSDGSSVIDCIINEEGDGFIDIADAHTEFLDTVVEIDEDLMEAYLGGEEIAPAKKQAAMSKAIISQHLVPVLFCSAKHETGVNEFVDFLSDCCPSPVNGLKAKLVKGEGDDTVETEVAPDASAPVVGMAFRVCADPKTNIKQTAIRLYSGHIESDTNLLTSAGKKMRAGQVQKLQGDTLEKMDSIEAGDIVVLSKLEDLHILDTLYSGNADPGVVKLPKLPVPMYSLALEPKSRGDEGKISGALHEIAASDPTFIISRDPQTHETIVSGVGELHARVVLNRMKHRRGLEVNTKPPRIPYKETILGSAKGIEYTHKKQSGGSGQFARVVIDVEANQSGAGYEFVDSIFGGSIDQQYRPSVDKGCQAAMEQGVLAGFPVVDVKVNLVDGKTHPVDSKDIAFQTAGREAFREGFLKAKPTLLEPIVHMEVTVPSEKVGDISGDLSGRRGRVQGQDVLPGNMTCIKAEVPLSEVQQYSSQLNSATGGMGSFSMELSHYEPAPPNVVQQVVEKAKADQEAAHA